MRQTRVYLAVLRTVSKRLSVWRARLFFALKARRFYDGNSSPCCEEKKRVRMRFQARSLCMSVRTSSFLSALRMFRRLRGSFFDASVSGRRSALSAFRDSLVAVRYRPKKKRQMCQKENVKREENLRNIDDKKSF